MLFPLIIDGVIYGFFLIWSRNMSKKKPNAFHQVDEGFFQDKLAEHFRISQPQVSRSIAKMQEFMRDVAKKHQKLLQKEKKPKKYIELYRV